MNTSKPKVSVLMPSLNVEKFIRQSVQSVVDQTLSDIEIICIDAGSTDGTLEVLEEFEASHDNVVLLRSPVKSYGAQMNMGLAAARGEYIGIVETDDYVDAHAFENLYNAAKAHGCDIVKANRYSLSETATSTSRCCEGFLTTRFSSQSPSSPTSSTRPLVFGALYTEAIS